MDFLSTPAFYLRWSDNEDGPTYKVEGVTERPLMEGDAVREYWRMPKDCWEIPDGCSTPEGDLLLVATEWICAQRIEPFVYRIEGRYLADGTGEPTGDIYHAINYFFVPGERGGTNLLRLWSIDSLPAPGLSRGYVDALQVVKRILDEDDA
jgi:hypothetical protein